MTLGLQIFLLYIMGAERDPMKVTKEQDNTLGALNITLDVSVSPLQMYKEPIPLNKRLCFKKTLMCISFTLI